MQPDKPPKQEPPVDKKGVSASLTKKREETARQIQRARTLERENPGVYRIHRSGKEYLYRMGGLEHYFNYLRSLKSKRVLDVGTGTGNATHIISEMPIAAGLDLEVTALRNIPELAKRFPKEKIHITSVENLRDIENESLAGVIGVNSISYSRHPELAVQRIDEVLIPGGAVKATFDLPGESGYYLGLVLKSVEEFVRIFVSLGYDVYYVENKFFPNVVDELKVNSILVAIKPGNPQAPSAKELLNLDFDYIKSTAIGRGKEGYPVFDNIDDS